MKILLSVVILATIFASPVASQERASVQEKASVKLDRRTDSSYLKSGYSFRYRSQNEQEHKNYVDLVYESGVMRINNHSGLKNRIADLGEMDGLKDARNIKQSDANWSQEMLKPLAGHSYALEVTEAKHKMMVVFHVAKVAEDKLEFEWQPVGSIGRWPVDLNRRGAAGTSGMMGGMPPESRSKYGEGSKYGSGER